MTKMKCSIIGSFRKYYNDIIEVIVVFENVGIEILSPKKTKITDEIDNFVILKTDKINEPIEIQLITFDRIFRSNFVYVFNPFGYVGRTTCYELGKIEQKNIPIYFYKKPKDLPILICSSNIISPEMLSKYYKTFGFLPKKDYSGISENIVKLYNALLNNCAKS